MKNIRIDTARFVVREKYLGAVEAFIDQPVVKVLKGMRRVGKSVIMRLLINRLIDKGVPDANILYINKESLEFDALKDYPDLYRYTRDYFKEGARSSPAAGPAVAAALTPGATASRAAPAAPASSAYPISSAGASPSGRRYILIDEIQEIEGWEKERGSWSFLTSFS